MSVKTIFQEIREKEFAYEFQEALRYDKDLNRVSKYTTLNTTIIKPNCIVNLPLYYNKKGKKFNTDSLKNLKQNNIKKYEKSTAIKNESSIENVNDWANQYKEAFKEENQGEKEYKGLFSNATKEKINRITNVFTTTVIKNYISTRGYEQQSITFCTFTLTEAQKHTDKEIIKMFVDFIDHLKKVKNPIICRITKKDLPNQAKRLQNYFWRAETQENGNIHFHMIADTFLNQHMLRRVWNLYLSKLGYKFGYGSANVNSLKRDKNNNKINDITKYLCKYMSKPPLKEKYKNLTSKEIKDMQNMDIYRRPIIGKSWGCSKSLLHLEYPKFYGKKALLVFKNLRQKLKQLKSEKIPNTIQVFIGNVKKAISEQTYKMQYDIKMHYIMCYQYLYDEIPDLDIWI